MVQQVKLLAAKSDNLILIPGTHTVEGRKATPPNVLLLSHVTFSVVTYFGERNQSCCFELYFSSLPITFHQFVLNQPKPMWLYGQDR